MKNKSFPVILSLVIFLAAHLLFSLAITSPVQLTGVFVVFASLIASALGAARHAGTRLELPIAHGIALLGLLSGFGVAIQYDLPLGPVLVCSFMLSALLTRVWTRKRAI